MENKRDHRGRPPQKPDYDPETLTRELMDTVVEVYHSTNSLKSTALELDLPPNKVKKLLITAKVLCYPETEQIQRLLKEYGGGQRGTTFQPCRHQYLSPLQ